MYTKPLNTFFFFTIALFFSFLLSSTISKLVINYFKRSNRGQSERNYLESNIKKEGTPTMGGISFILSTVITFILFSINHKYNSCIYFYLFVCLGFGLIGFIDDYLKLKKRNYDGLKSYIRILLEVNVIVFGLLILTPSFNININISSSPYYLGLFTIPFIIFVMVGSSNAMNLTDGIDGLASGLYMIALTPFLFIALLNNNYLLSLLIMCEIGGILGFLKYNLHPAKLFMGDVGSLFLGASLASFAIIENKILVLVIAALIMVVETISVIIQVTYYKLTKKRIFLMTPIHHHFQKKGWPEWKIVLTFWIIGVALAASSMIFGI